MATSFVIVLTDDWNDGSSAVPIWDIAASLPEARAIKSIRRPIGYWSKDRLGPPKHPTTYTLAPDGDKVAGAIHEG